jgi:hypothetical protein
MNTAASFARLALRPNDRVTSAVGHERRVGPICNISALTPIAGMRTSVDLRRCGPKAEVSIGNSRPRRRARGPFTSSLHRTLMGRIADHADSQAEAMRRAAGLAKRGIISDKQRAKIAARRP